MKCILKTPLKINDGLKNTLTFLEDLEILSSFPDFYTLVFQTEESSFSVQVHLVSLATKVTQRFTNTILNCS